MKYEIGKFMDRKGETIMGKVIATCTSEIKGVQKKNVHQVCLIEDYGIEGDAHAGKWHRQVSLLSYDRISSLEISSSCNPISALVVGVIIG